MYDKSYTTMQSYLNIRETVRTLLRHRKLADRRSFGSDGNKFAKAMIYLSAAFVLIYLIGLSIPFAIIANESRTMTSAELLCTLLPFILAIDFALRFLVQQTPAQIVRPYMLLPLSHYACIDTFIFSSVVSIGNLTWLAFVLPYTLMSMLFGYGIQTTAITILMVVILIAVNSLWYAVVRTLVIESAWWWALPAAVYTLLASPLYIGNDAGFDQLCDTYAAIGSLIDRHSPLALLIPLIMLAAIACINRKVQYKYTKLELMRVEKKHELKKVHRFAFLERYGKVGTFLQLEIKLVTRNKNPRKAFFSGIFTMLILSVVIITSDIYDSIAMTNFWAFYNMVLLGATILTRIMGYEGNYIDCLLVRREDILALLKAKYIFYSALLALPTMLMIPVVISGKWSLYMLVSYAVFTMGFQHFLLFQTAVYNKQTIALNEKLTTKGGLDGNYTQMLIMAAIFIVPSILVNTLQTLLNENTVYTIILAIGIFFVLTHNIWLRNIYKRMMRRKYDNLESFTATR